MVATKTDRQIFVTTSHCSLTVDKPLLTRRFNSIAVLAWRERRERGGVPNKESDRGVWKASTASSLFCYKWKIIFCNGSLDNHISKLIFLQDLKQITDIVLKDFQIAKDSLDRRQLRNV